MYRVVFNKVIPVNLDEDCAYSVVRSVPSRNAISIDGELPLEPQYIFSSATQTNIRTYIYVIAMGLTLAYYPARNIYFPFISWFQLLLSDYLKRQCASQQYELRHCVTRCRYCETKSTIFRIFFENFSDDILLTLIVKRQDKNKNFHCTLQIIYITVNVKLHKNSSFRSMSGMTFHDRPHVTHRWHVHADFYKMCFLLVICYW